MDEPRCTTCGLVMTPKNAKLRPELLYCDGCLPVMFRPRPAEHTSNAPHVGQAAQLYTELLEAKRLLADARAECDRLLIQEIDLRDREVAGVRQRDAASAELDDLGRKYLRLAEERDRLRDAARAFLALLDRHQFSSVALRGPELDELRRLCE